MLKHKVKNLKTKFFPKNRKFDIIQERMGEKQLEEKNQIHSYGYCHDNNDHDQCQVLLRRWN
jgi:hypothetical protein